MTDIAINEKTPVANGAAVSTTNPLPVTASTTAGGSGSITINPVSWSVNGAIVSLTNPLPVTMS